MTFLSATGQPPGPATSTAGPLGTLRMTPGRWVAVAIGVPVAIALIGWTGLGLVTASASGSFPVSYAFPVQNGQVSLNINAGDLTLRQGQSRGTALLTGTVHYGLIRPGFDPVRTSNGVDATLDCSQSIGGKCGMSASLDVPAQTGVTLSSNGGDVTASGFSSGMTVWAAGGNLNVSNLAGNLRLDTGGGNLTGNGLNGTIAVDTEGGNIEASDWTGTGTTQLNTGGGDMTVNALTGDFQLVTQGGNVDASGVTAAASSTQSGGGAVTLTLAQVPDTLSISAEGGNVTVVLPAGDTKYDISTPDIQGGKVDYPSSLVASNSPHKITIDSGGGDVIISQG